MDSKIEEKYTKTLFLETIKTGKTPKRSGLGNRLYILGGNTAQILTTLQRNLNPPTQLKHQPEFSNRISFYINSWNYSSRTVVDYLYSQDMTNVFRKYLGDYHISRNYAYVFVYFKHDCIISWALLDEELKLKYPHNHRINKYGFVYHKS